MNAENFTALLANYSDSALYLAFQKFNMFCGDLNLKAIGLL